MKYTPEQIATLMETAKSYTTNGKVDWVAVYRDTDIAHTIFGGSTNKMQGTYNRTLVKQFKHAKTGRTNYEQTAWTQEELNELFLLQKRFQAMSPTGRSFTDWKLAKEQGALNNLLVSHSFKEITSRLHYENRKLRGAPTSGHKYKIKRKAKVVETTEPEVIEARHAEVERQVGHHRQAALDAVNCSINYCPHCGYHIAGMILPA